MPDINLRGLICANDDAVIYKWYGFGDITSPGMVAQALEDANGEPVTLLVNSNGGDMMAGNEIRSILRRYTGDTVALIQGSAASAATLAMQGCDIVRSEPGAMICAHNPASQTYGDYRDKKADAESLINARDACINVYRVRGKGKKTRREIASLMDKDIWSTPQQALDYGIIDEVIDDDAGADGTTMTAAAGSIYTITDEMRDAYVKAHAKPNTATKEPDRIAVTRARLDLLKNT